MENNLKEIKEFINQWKVRAINYYKEALDNYKEEKKQLINYGVGSDEYKRKKLELIEKYGKWIMGDLALRSPKDAHEQIVKTIERDGEAKEKMLIKRVNKEVGSIVKAISLSVGVNGELNGYIKGENGTCRIETIYAGGYNIQCLHYRVLVHKVNA